MARSLTPGQYGIQLPRDAGNLEEPGGSHTAADAHGHHDVTDTATFAFDKGVTYQP